MRGAGADGDRRDHAGGEVTQPLPGTGEIRPADVEHDRRGQGELEPGIQLLRYVQREFEQYDDGQRDEAEDHPRSPPAKFTSLAGGEMIGEGRAVDLQEDSGGVIGQAMPGRAEDVVGAAAKLGILVEGTYQDMVQLLVPIALLESLATKEEIVFIRLPWEIEPLGSITGEGVAVIGADDWHAAGFTGEGVKVAILDLGFDGYQGLLGNELPSSVVVHSCVAGGDITGGGIVHGTAVAEIVHEIAPDAQLYFANIETIVEMASCVDWLKTQDVDIVNFSVGFFASGPGDGTGPVNDIVNDAKNQGILWVNSAGNHAQKHWMGSWTDNDTDDIHNFAANANSNVISSPAGATTHCALRWYDPLGEQ